MTTDTPAYRFNIIRQDKASHGPNWEYHGTVPGGDVVHVTDAQTGAVVASQISPARATALYGFTDPIDVGSPLVYTCARCADWKLSPVTEARYRATARQPIGPVGPIVCDACRAGRAA